MISVTKTIGNTDFNYKLITGGAKFALPQGMPVTLYCNGRAYSGKMHSKTVGRIDGLSVLYKETGLQIGDEITLTYDLRTDIIYVEIVGQEYELKFAEDDFDIEIRMEPEQAVNPKLKAIQDSFEPVAVHFEYYHENDFVYPVTINGQWILCDQSENAYLFAENNHERIELSLNRKKGDWLLGMNRKGVWYAACADTPTWDGTDWCNEIVCVDLAGNTQRRVLFNPERASIDGEVYIYDNNAYYIARVSERQQKLMWVDTILGVERVLYSTRVGEEISRVSADATRVTYRIKYDGEVRWIVQTIGAQERTELGTRSNPNRSWEPLVKIHVVDLKRNVLWTTMTEAERVKWGGTETDLVARPLEDPIDGRVCVYKSDRAPVIYRNSKELEYERYWYFDGNDLYVGQYNSPLVRTDKKGVQYQVGDPNVHLHGNTKDFIVSDSYVYVDYDGFCTVCLPRKFHESKQSGRDNPEAKVMDFYLG